LSSIWDPAFRLVLASGSSTRRRLLAAAGLPFETRAPNVDERAIESILAPSADVALTLARAKALAVSAETPDSLVLGADQVLALGGSIIHKSHTRVLGSVGVYQWEGFGMHLFEKVAGDHTTILGLPMLKLLAALRELGALKL